MLVSQAELYAEWEKWWAEHWEDWDGAEVSQIAVAFADHMLERGHKKEAERG